MPIEKTDDEVAAERRWLIERARWRFRYAMAIVLLLILMYFVVDPVSTAYGQPLDLPPVELVALFLALISFPAFGVHFGAADIAKGIVSRIKISVAEPGAKQEHSDDRSEV